MVLNSPEQHVSAEETIISIRGADALTTSYVASDTIDISYAKSLLIVVSIVGIGITDSQMKVQFSDSLGSVWYDLCHLDSVATANPNIIITEFELGGSTVTMCIPIINPGAALMRTANKANAAAGAHSIGVIRGNSVRSFPMVNGS